MEGREEEVETEQQKKKKKKSRGPDHFFFLSLDGVRKLSTHREMRWFILRALGLSESDDQCSEGGKALLTHVKQ